MINRRSYRGLRCPVCRYALEGLSQPICPECGEPFDPDWLYSVDYEYAIQWTPRRRAIAWSTGVIIAVLLFIAAASVGAAYLCMVCLVLGLGAVTFLARRMR